jgi:aerobic-type carbon monoxide dehydrogenase small subunit (CoxS/CutS family)
MSKKTPDEPRPSEPARRRFLKTGAAGALGVGLLGGAAPAAEETAEPDVTSASGVFGPTPVTFSLSVNGEARRVRLEPRVTLLDALRDHLGLTGAKRVCDRGGCGACTVLLDGKAVYACALLAIEARGRSVETVESLGRSGPLHPIQAAFVEHDAVQCGFCTPGFVMAAKALLAREPSPTADSVARALGGNLCRCGAYDGIRRAVTRGLVAEEPSDA